MKRSQFDMVGEVGTFDSEEFATFLSIRQTWDLAALREVASEGWRNIKDLLYAGRLKSFEGERSGYVRRWRLWSEIPTTRRTCSRAATITRHGSGCTGETWLRRRRECVVLLNQ